MFTEDEKREIISHFEQAWPEVVMYLPDGADLTAAATDVMADYAVDRAAIRRPDGISHEEMEWLRNAALDRC